MANSMRARIRELENQIHAARFAMHKVRVKEYFEAVRRGELTPEEACRRYQQAMTNFEDVLNGAKDGHFREAIDREMAEFDLGVTMVNALPEPEQEAAE
jgi:polyhydroxyalkanoate synthesis regulator phasin